VAGSESSTAPAHTYAGSMAPASKANSKDFLVLAPAQNPPT
jgi:hypothetical protein